MKIEVKIDPSVPETGVVITAPELTSEVQQLVAQLSDASPQVLTGLRDGRVEVLEQPELIRVYASGGKVYAVTERGTCVLRYRLYELEERLDKRCFVRISNAEIINLHRVRSFDLSLTGTICVRLQNGEVTYVSRRYVARIRQLLNA